MNPSSLNMSTMNIDQPDHVVVERYLSFKQKLKETGFRYLSCGDFRAVYRRKNYVVKVPINIDGIIDNIVEFKGWKKYGYRPTNLGLVLAPCRLLNNNCLMMVRVKTTGLLYPDWANKVDNCQVGEYRGRVVAYDYALNITERLSWEKELNIEGSYFQRYWLHNRAE